MRRWTGNYYIFKLPATETQRAMCVSVPWPYHAFTHHSPWCPPAVVCDDSRPCIAHITFQPIMQQVCNIVDLWVKWNLLSQSWIALQHGIAVAKPADIMKSVDSHINNEYSKGSVKVIRHRYKLDPL